MRNFGRALCTAALLGGLLSWPSSAQVSSDQTILFRTFQLALKDAQSRAYVGHAGFRVRDGAAFETMRAHIIRMYEGSVVVGSYQRDGEIFDCTTVASQPSVRLLGLHSIASPPPFSPLAGARPHVTDPSIVEVSQDTSNERDAFGHVEWCQPGTIPMRRLTLDNIATYETLDQFFQKSSYQASSVPLQPANNGHSYAILYRYVNNWGGSDYINLWRPAVNLPLGEQFSISQEWYVGASNTPVEQTAEAGWVNGRYGTSNQHTTTSSALFVFWTPNDYNPKGPGCWNLDCPGFVQYSSKVALGSTFTNYSTTQGTQYEVGLGYYLYQGNWWFSVGGDWIGYYPGSVYAGGQLTKNAQLIEFGGETLASQNEWPFMGSGHFASTGFKSAAYHRLIYYRDVVGNFNNPPQMTVQQLAPACYTATSQIWGGTTWATYFFFGGPGGKKC